MYSTLPGPRGIFCWKFQGKRTMKDPPPGMCEDGIAWPKWFCQRCPHEQWIRCSCWLIHQTHIFWRPAPCQPPGWALGTQRSTQALPSSRLQSGNKKLDSCSCHGSYTAFRVSCTQGQGLHLITLTEVGIITPEVKLAWNQYSNLSLLTPKHISSTTKSYPRYGTKLRTKPTCGYQSSLPNLLHCERRACDLTPPLSLGDDWSKPIGISSSPSLMTGSHHTHMGVQIGSGDLITEKSWTLFWPLWEGSFFFSFVNASEKALGPGSSWQLFCTDEESQPENSAHTWERTEVQE